MCGYACLCPKHKFYKPILAMKELSVICSVADGGWDVEGEGREHSGLWLKQLGQMVVSFTEMEKMGEGHFSDI